jgi:hypothetical protein
VKVHTVHLCARNAVADDELICHQENPKPGTSAYLPCGPSWFGGRRPFSDPTRTPSDPRHCSPHGGSCQSARIV